MRTEEQFTFTAFASMDQVAPLFGASMERVWAPGWDPHFVFPERERDAPGMVFTVQHQQTKVVWVNTEFDLRSGRLQYVYVVPDAMVTVITLRISADGDYTHVQVQYDRTALSATSDPDVRQLAEQDRRAGPEWERQVNDWLSRTKQDRPNTD